MRKGKDVTGKRFGKLVVIGKSDKKSKDNRTLWICKCDCGNMHYVTADHLIHGTVKSCGCIRKKQATERFLKASENNVKHRGSNTALYKIWTCIKQRCENPKNPAYKYYGALGIKVCEEWQDFNAFQKWAFENGYFHDTNVNMIDRLSIDRVNSNKGYYPENCRWITMKENLERAREVRTLRNKVTEAEEQKVLFEWISLNLQKYPELKLCYHIPNGGKRDIREARNLQAQGVKPGVPDICLPVPNGKYHGLFIELKRANGGVVSAYQKKWLLALNNEGYLAIVAYGANEAIKCITEYLNAKNAK